MSERNPTTNHDLPRPDTGTFDGTWGTDVMNTDLTATLEQTLVVRDTAANRSNYTAYNDALFIATDTGQAALGDGTNWMDLGIVPAAHDHTGDNLTPTSVDAGSYSVDNDSALLSVAASGDVTLSSGTGTVDTGLSATDATFYLALGVDDPDADVELAGKLFWDDSAGTYKVAIDEVDTSVGNPTVNYDVLRVR